MSPSQRHGAVPQAARHGVAAPLFVCASWDDGPRATWVEASGELDLAGAPRLDQMLREAAMRSQLTLLDLHELTFIDSSGVHVIEDAAVRALLLGRRLVVSRAPAHVRRVSALSGTDGSIEFV